MGDNTLQQSPEDIFADLDAVPPPSAISSLPPSVPVLLAAPVASPPRRRRFGRWVFFIFLFGVVIGGGWWVAPMAFSWWQTHFSAVQDAQKTPDPSIQIPVASPPTPDLSMPPVVDQDGDGLTDIEEGELHTNPTLLDTDHDGLTDRAEVRIYQTNPLQADTDGDGYQDGDEVRHFYNPRGSGKLIDIINEIEQRNVLNE